MRFDRPLDCFAAPSAAALPLHAVRPEGVAGFLAALPEPLARYLAGSGFAAAAQHLILLPGPAGVAGAVLGLGADRTPWAFGDLAWRLPEGTIWRLEPGDYDPARAALGFALGAYRFSAFKAAPRAAARLIAPEGAARAAREAQAIWLARDLINTPANLLGPRELAQAVVEIGAACGAAVDIITGAVLDEGFPALAAVGRGSARAPAVALLRWRGSSAGDDAPLVALCGKGVCFDTGGYDLKPASAMLRMKKDMGGAAAVLGAARAIMAADWPVRLALRIGCVENSVSGSAMRPSDVLSTRKGLSVEVGNTDAEGRLVLADLLAAACEEAPALVVDCATLTGAARAALGPDLPALFSNDPAWAATFLTAGQVVCDPLWQLPLWDDYGAWLASTVADLNNIAGNTHGGAVVAALFLERFIAKGTAWVHIDLYAWNDATRPGRPEGGEGQAVRAICAAIEAGLLSACSQGAARSPG
uniref:Leucyl aminopeptidase family protein n=1 Tax=Acidicaldus sp. TaxID=1872105 RepID=A0A8J4HC68_9PROT